MNTDLRVAVCTNRSPDATLEALRSQVPAEALTVVVSGRLDPAFLGEPRPGLSHARNRALAWAAEAGSDVLAFVDDDVRVDPGWYSALVGPWGEGPAGVALLGAWAPGGGAAGARPLPGRADPAALLGSAPAVVLGRDRPRADAARPRAGRA